MCLQASKHSGLGGWERLCSEQPPSRLMWRQPVSAGTDGHCLLSCKIKGGCCWSYQAPTSTCARRMLPKNGGRPVVLGAKGRSWCKVTEVRETNGRAIYQLRVKRLGGRQPQSIQLRMSSGCKLGEYPGKYYICLWSSPLFPWYPLTVTFGNKVKKDFWHPYVCSITLLFTLVK